MRSRSIGPSSESSSNRHCTGRRSDRRTPPRGWASCSCSHDENTSSKRPSACVSVRTANAGSTRASTGRSRRRSAQNVWMVLMCASSKSCTASSSSALAADFGAAFARDRSSSSRRRSFSSPAAFSLNVTATISPIAARLFSISATMRPTSSVVLPVPAAASTMSVVSSCRRNQPAILGTAAAALRGWRRHGMFLNASRSAKSCRVFSARPSLLLAAAHDPEVTPIAGLGFRSCRERAVFDRAIDDVEHLDAALRRLAHQRDSRRDESRPRRAKNSRPATPSPRKSAFSARP